MLTGNTRHWAARGGKLVQLHQKDASVPSDARRQRAYGILPRWHFEGCKPCGGDVLYGADCTYSCLRFAHATYNCGADLVSVGCLWAHHRGVEVPAALYVTCRLRFRRKKITAVIFIIALPQPLFLWFILPEEISFLYHLTFLDIAAWTKFMSRIKLCPCFIESRYFS